MRTFIGIFWKQIALGAAAGTVLALLIVPRCFATITTTNNGDGTTRLRADYLIPTAQVTDVRDDICRGLSWTATVTCTQAMVNAVPPQCTAGQLGTQVANPETCINRIDREIRAHLRNLRRAGELKELEDTVVTPARNADKSGDLQ